MRKINNCFLVLSSMLILASCNDSGSNSNGSASVSVPTCVHECVDSMAIVCDDLGGTDIVDCAYGCSDDTCDPAPGKDKCHPQCSLGIANSCDKDGAPERQECLFGCDGAVCASACKPSCENGVATQCNADGFPEYVECPKGCDGSACASLVCKPSCVDGVATECNADGSSSTRRCPNGCEGNVCAPEIMTGPCKGVACENEGSCDRGICVSHNMASVAEDDKCDKWFQGYCDGDIKVTCEGGKIHYAYCADVNGCAMSKVKHFGETYLIPTCRKDGASCRSGMNSYCVTENNGGKSEAHTYAIACWDNTDDTMSGDKGGGDYLLCAANGCNPQKTTCWNKCSGETLLVYDESTMNCSAINQICVTEEQNGFCADACWQEGENLLSCFQGNERRRECRKDDNGKLYYVDEIFPCDHGCDESTGKCKKIVRDEYSACDWNAFKQRCENGIRVSCYEGIVRAEKCSDSNQFCAVSENAAVCYDCKHEFNKTTGECSKEVADEYTPCNKSRFTERCENGSRVICEDGIVRAVQCDGGKSCGVTGNRATCTESCDREQTSYCDGNKLITQICAPNEAGVLVPKSQTEIECPDRCDPNKKACTCSQGGYWCENNAVTHCDPVSETLVFEDCGSKFCGALSSNDVQCFDKKYNSLNDCQNDYGCNGKTYHEAACVSVPNEAWIYGKVSSEYCDTGCSKEDKRCCAASEYYNSTQNACVCDTRNHWTGTAGRCQCESGYQLNVDKCEAKCEGRWAGKDNRCCDANKEYVNAQGACACNTSGHWTGTAGNCKCATGYQPNASGTSCGKISCPAHSSFDEKENACLCDEKYAPNNAGDACVCDSSRGLVASGNDCICPFGYKYDSEYMYCASLEPGDTLYFGKYYYNNNVNKENIEWRVLSAKDDKILLISKYILDFVNYETDRNTKNNDYYETSEMKQWLENDFFNAAFSSKEAAQIVETTYEYTIRRQIGYGSTKYSYPQSITSKIFMPSGKYINSYLRTEKDRVAASTPYASDVCSDVSQYCVDNRWWLLDVFLYYSTQSDYSWNETSSEDVDVVYGSGDIRDVDNRWCEGYYGVRPIITLSRNKQTW